MQEEVENRTVNLAISTTKLTGRTIIAGIRKYLQHREKVKMKKARDPAVHGKQSVKQLLGQNQGATNVEIDKESIRDFEKLAKKYGVDFAVRKDKSVDPPRFLVFVRSKDADVESHKDELTAFNKAYRILKKHGADLNVDLKALQKEYDGLRTTHADLKEQLAAVNEELKPMKDIRYWVSKVLSPEQTGEKQPEPKHSLKERLQYEQEQKKQKQVQKAPKQKKQDMEL